MGNFRQEIECCRRNIYNELSFSFSNEELDQGTRTDVAGGSTVGTKAHVVNEVDSMQIAYTMGGLTLGVAKIEESNIDFGSTSDDKTVISVAHRLSSIEDYDLIYFLEFVSS